MKKQFEYPDQRDITEAMNIIGVLDHIDGNTMRKFIERTQGRIIYLHNQEHMPVKYKNKLAKLILEEKK